MADFELISKITGVTTYLEDLSGTYVTSVSSGYTFASPFVARVNLTSGTSPATILNGCTLLWHFGDGTELQDSVISYNKIQSPTHTYKWPGQYEVKLSVVSNDGLSSVTFSNVLSVSSYVKDSIEWVYSGWTDLSSNNLSAGAVFHGFQSSKPGALNQDLPLTIRYTSSTLLSSRINFDLYSQNSLSQPWEIATLDNKYANLRPRWRFLDLSGNNVSNILVNPDQITAIVIDAKGKPASSLEFDITTATVVGYSGTLDFYYIDDIPSLTYNGSAYTVSVPTLWVTSNTSSYYNYQDKNDGQQPSYSNNVTSLSSLFYVKNLSATNFDITLNGGTIQLPGTLWPSTSGSFIVSINSAAMSGKPLLNYPINYNNTAVQIYSTPALATTFSASSFNFSRTDSLGRDRGGFYKNTLYTADANSSLLSSGSLTTTVIVSAASATVFAEPPADALSGYNPATRVAAATAFGSLHVVPLTGSITYNIVDFNKNYFVRKINEDFNYGAQLQTYALQPTIAADENLFAFLSAMAGSSYTPNENYGTVVYEKTSNFVSNTQDIHNSNINSLYSLADSIDNQFDNYNLNAPPVLKRALDLYSIQHERLWGTREKNNTNFNNASNHTNLGYSLTAYDVKTTIVSAGQKIVLNSIFDPSFYELLEVPAINSYASVTAANMQTHFTSGMSYPLTAYPLSAFFGWGVKTPVESYYKFWVYNDVYSNVPVCNTIDWNTKTDGLSTTLSESVSSITEWYKDGGILENIYSYYLYKGLDLI